MDAIYEIVTMTNWLPDLSQGSGPLYVRLAERIESDIGSGTLPAGTKLPPQRDLAFDIGVTIGTVGRAYALVRERGLVSGEVGRGTFVLGRRAGPADCTCRRPWHLRGHARHCRCRASCAWTARRRPMSARARSIERLTAEILREHPDEIVDYTRSVAGSLAEAGSALADDRRLDAGSADSIVPTLGAHAAVMAVIAAIDRAGRQDSLRGADLFVDLAQRQSDRPPQRRWSAVDEDGADPGRFRAAVRAAAPEDRLPDAVAAQPDAGDHAAGAPQGASSRSPASTMSG